EKTNLGIKIRTDLAALYEKFEPAVPVVQASTEVGLTSRNKWRASLSRVTRQHEVLHHHDPRVYSSALIERRRCVARALIDGQEPNVRTARKRALYSEHSIVRIRVRPTRPGTCVHGTHVETGNRTRHLSSSIHRYLLAGDRINSNLAAEEKQISGATHCEVENAGVLKKELAFFWKE